uniref:Uncharacterized protein n=1 Tax=Tetraselmis chuii TaxID=63592 RepID=A0A6U1KVM5_9CHLO|mmetsp:Transcript_7077/g.12846  ORF Transcript_7077/g.12846 Transcript_7077/m.12846 type:complete len:179 (+) Transcript_7077:295-831(+)
MMSVSGRRLLAAGKTRSPLSCFRIETYLFVMCSSALFVVSNGQDDNMKCLDELASAHDAIMYISIALAVVFALLLLVGLSNNNSSQKSLIGGLQLLVCVISGVMAILLHKDIDGFTCFETLEALLQFAAVFGEEEADRVLLVHKAAKYCAITSCVGAGVSAIHNFAKLGTNANRISTL